MSTPLDIVAAASSLEEGQLEQLIEKLQVLRALSGKQKKEAAEVDDSSCSLFYRLLCEWMRTAGYAPPDYYIFRAKSRYASTFCAAVQNMDAWLLPHLPRRSPSARASVYAWIAEMVVTRAALFGNVWVGVLYNMENLPQVLDRELPGYAVSGLLQWALRARTRGGRNDVREQPNTKTRVEARRRASIG